MACNGFYSAAEISPMLMHGSNAPANTIQTPPMKKKVLKFQFQEYQREQVTAEGREQALANMTCNCVIVNTGVGGPFRACWEQLVLRLRLTISLISC